MRRLATLVCLWILLRLAAQARPAYFIDDGRLRSEHHGFSFPVPSGWGQGNAGEGGILLARLIRESGRADFRVIVQSAKGQTMPTAEEVENGLVRSVRGFHITEMKPWTLGGAKFQEYRAVGSAGARLYSLFYGFANGRAFLFLLSANKEDGDRARSEVVAALKAMQFFDAKDKAPDPAGAIEVT